MNITKTLPTLALISLLTACGGGGGSTNHQPSADSTPTKQSTANSTAADAGDGQTKTSSKNIYIAPKITEPAGPNYNWSTTTINSHVFSNTEANDFSKIFPLGYSESKYSEEETRPKPSSNNPYRSSREEGLVKAYHLPHSIILGSTLIKLFRDDKEVDIKTLHPTYTDFNPAAIGEFTKPEIVNKMSGSFQYKGVALSSNGQGVFNYHVDFAQKTGSGEITGLKEHGRITLHKAAITDKLDSTLFQGITSKPMAGIEGKATGSNLGSNPVYRLGFFGPKAEEVAGHIETRIFDKYGNLDYIASPVGFSGSRE